MKNFLTSFGRIFWGPKASKNGEICYVLDIYLIFIHVDAFRVEKVDELAHNTIFTGSPSLENFGLKNTISF